MCLPGGSPLTRAASPDDIDVIDPDETPHGGPSEHSPRPSFASAPLTLTGAAVSSLGPGGQDAAARAPTWNAQAGSRMWFMRGPGLGVEPTAPSSAAPIGSTSEGDPMGSDGFTGRPLIGRSGPFDFRTHFGAPLLRDGSTPSAPPKVFAYEQMRLTRFRVMAE